MITKFLNYDKHLSVIYVSGQKTHKIGSMCRVLNYGMPKIPATALTINNLGSSFPLDSFYSLKRKSVIAHINNLKVIQVLRRAHT